MSRTAIPSLRRIRAKTDTVIAMLMDRLGYKVPQFSLCRRFRAILLGSPPRAVAGGLGEAPATVTGGQGGQGGQGGDGWEREEEKEAGGGASSASPASRTSRGISTLSPLPPSSSSPGGKPSKPPAQREASIKAVDIHDPSLELSLISRVEWPADISQSSPIIPVQMHFLGHYREPALPLQLNFSKFPILDVFASFNPFTLKWQIQKTIGKNTFCTRIFLLRKTHDTTKM